MLYNYSLYKDRTDQTKHLLVISQSELDKSKLCARGVLVTYTQQLPFGNVLHTTIGNTTMDPVQQKYQQL